LLLEESDSVQDKNNFFLAFGPEVTKGVDTTGSELQFLSKYPDSVLFM
jgi:hypothetical protein